MHWFVSHLIYFILTKPQIRNICFTDTSHLRKGGCGYPPLELDISQKHFFLRKGY